MNPDDISMVRVLSIAGSTLAIGFTFGWLWALLHGGGAGRASGRQDCDEGDGR